MRGTFEDEGSWLRACVLGNDIQRPLRPLLTGTSRIAGAHPLKAEAGGRACDEKEKTACWGLIYRVSTVTW